LGFMVVFRMQLAYNRYWEAAITTHELRATWFSAASSLFAFTTDKPEKQDEVIFFEHFLVRLMSMMHASACERLDSKAEYVIMDNDGMEKESLKFLATSSDRCEVIEQWIERLVVQNLNSGVITIAPPILSRVFGDLSKGILDLGHLEVVSDFPLPFPYAQMTAFLLLFHFIVTPIIASLIMYNFRWAACLAFTSTFCLWSINYIAMEIEQPFADTRNSLPGSEMQYNFNRALAQLLDPLMQTPPSLKLENDTISYLKIRTAVGESHLKAKRTEDMLTNLRPRRPDKDAADEDLDI
jgi:predicted membrane chloride channel (bestrophin family)